MFVLFMVLKWFIYLLSSYIKMIILSLILLKLDLIAQLNYPYIVEYKDAWVEKVRTESLRL